MKHTDQVKNYPGSHEELAENLGDLYYGSLAEFLHQLSAKLEKDGHADKGRGRSRLATELLACSQRLQEAAAHIDRAWEICEPYVKK
ncbi:MAG: hypothetical protein ACFCA4_07500 [Cyanophyceae cyanobacterium]